MGIYDRDYVRRERPRGGGGGIGGRRGLGHPRGWSFNAWLIAVNIAVFVFGSVFLAGAGKPVMIEETIRAVPISGKIGESQDFFLAGSGRPATDAELRRTSTPLLTRPLVDAETGQQIGRRLYSVQNPLERWGHFSTSRGFGMLEVWRLITFQFLHAGILHLAFNMMGLYFFGGLVEQYLGKKRYAAFYLMCGMCGGLLYLLLNLLGYLGVALPGALHVDPSTPLVGASAGVFGVIIACAFIAPTSVVQLLFPPIPLKMRTFAYGYVAIAALNLLWGGNNAGGDAAHIGGAIAGFFFIRRPHLLREFFDVFGNSSLEKARPGRSVGSKKGGDASEIDAILDKVRQDGIHSLSASEKKKLQQATDERRG